MEFRDSGTDMFNWIRCIFRLPESNPRKSFVDSIDDLNKSVCGGDPMVQDVFLGRLEIRSGSLLLGDPQNVQSVEVSEIDAGDVSVSASIWQYPAGGMTVRSIKLIWGDPVADGERRKIGELGVDSAKLIVVDKADFLEHWTETGKDRIGVILTPQNDNVLRLLKKKFRFKTKRVSAWRCEVLEPVSESTERLVEEYLESIPQYAQFPFMHFHVETNNSFDRANSLREAWGFIPVGNVDVPKMLVCNTGRGDGVYDVEGLFINNKLRELSIAFIED